MSMKKIELAKGIEALSTLDYDLKVFDVIMKTEFGSSYNAYLIHGKEKTALVDGTKPSFFGGFLDALKGEKPDYLVVNHTEPDHSSSLELMLKTYPDSVVVATPVGLDFARQLVNHDFPSLPVKGSLQLDLGERVLELVAMPNLHWPDTMWVYDKESEILFPCDGFGAHFCSPYLRLSEMPDEVKRQYREARKFYYDVIMSPFASFVDKGLSYAKALPLKMIAPGHGPVIDEDIEQLYADYEKFNLRKEKDQVVIAYGSAYGKTRKLAEALAKGVRESGLGVCVFDLENANLDAVAKEVLSSRGFLLGSCTILSDALPVAYELTTRMNPVAYHGKRAAAFGVYGWSGEAVANLSTRLGQLRMKVEEGLRVRFEPTVEELKQAQEYGKQFGLKITKGE